MRERLPSDPRAIHAARAIWETEAFLAEALRHPQRYPRIPVVRIGYGHFPPGLAEEFWNDVLALSAA